MSRLKNAFVIKAKVIDKVVFFNTVWCELSHFITVYPQQVMSFENNTNANLQQFLAKILNYEQKEEALITCDQSCKRFQICQASDDHPNFAMKLSKLTKTSQSWSSEIFILPCFFKKTKQTTLLWRFTSGQTYSFFPNYPG